MTCRPQDEYLDLKRNFAAFGDSIVQPIASSSDSEQALPRYILESAARQGFFGLNICGDYGGRGFDPLTFGVFHEEMGRASSSLRSIFTAHAMVAYAIERWGSTQQRDRYLPRMASGELIGSFALSEEAAGSDIRAIQSAAKLESNGLRLEGSKRWVTGGQIAGVFLVFVNTADGPTALLIDREHLTHTPERVANPLGIRAAMLAHLDLSDCMVSTSAIVGRMGFGLSHVAAPALDLGRYSIAWGCTGISEGCLRLALQHAKDRVQFGRPLIEHELIQRLVSLMMVNTEASRLLCKDAGESRASGDPESFGKTAMAKYFASRTATQSSLDSLQIHGAAACSDTHRVAQYVRDARIMEIIEGSTQILETLIPAIASPPTQA